LATNDQIILSKLLEEKRREVTPELKESDFFEIFVTEQILKDYDISNDEIDEGIVGNGGDGGIDAFHIFVNGELLHEDSDLAVYKGDIVMSVHIMQATRSGGFSEETINRFRSSSESLLDLSKDLNDFRNVFNQKLLSLAAKFREAYTKYAAKLPSLSFHYYYVTTGTEVHPNVKRKVDSLKKSIRGLFSNAEFAFNFIDAKSLLELARKSTAKSFNLKLAEAPISSPNSFICLINLMDYYAFITDESRRLRRGIFDANVRDYQGDIEVNRSIRTTLENPEEEDFWWLNNGITIIVDEVVYSTKFITIKNPQIVNGLQTSQEVFHVLQRKTADKRNILVRILKPEHPVSYQRIVRATNSQTTVSPASLRTTDPFHRDIEDYLKGNKLYYERRKNFYKNEGRPRDSIISVSYLAQAVMAVLLGRPNDARARPSTLLKNDDDYIKVFSSEYPIHMFLVCALLMKKCEAYLRRKGIETKEVNNLKYHLAMYASRIAANSVNPTAEQIARINVIAISEDFLHESYRNVLNAYRSTGGDDQAAKGPKMVDKLTKKLAKKV
jgi:hypothetical protein